MELYTLHLFAGAGGGILADLLLGHRPIGAVEIEEYPRRVLLQRQLDGLLPRFPVWDDVRTFRADNPATASYIERLRTVRDRLCISGGFPCQDISAANSKGKGIDGERSGLWREFARVVGEVGPRYVFVENSPMLTIRGLGRVLGDLATLGYDAQWGVFGASDAIFLEGDPVLYHDRYRIFILAVPHSHRPWQLQSQGGEQDKRRWSGNMAAKMSDTQRAQRWPAGQSISGDWQERIDCLLRRTKATGWSGAMGKVDRKSTDSMQRRLSATSEEPRQEWTENLAAIKPCSPVHSWWSAEPGLGRMAHGMSNRNDRCKAIGNGQVPAVAALAWRTLTEGLIC